MFALLARRSLSSILAALTLAMIIRPVAAQDAAADIENAKYQFAGSVNANSVYVRSGPSENDYAVMKLDRGVDLTVVGIRFEWLKIAPPEGSFCYVAKAYVERNGTGSSGRVTSTLNVRVGSLLNDMKTKLATKLNPGDTVQITGEKDEYFQIKPPANVFLYVNKQFVDPVKQLAANDKTEPAVNVPTTPIDPTTPTPTDAPVTPTDQIATPTDANPTATEPEVVTDPNLTVPQIPTDPTIDPTKTSDLATTQQAQPAAKLDPETQFDKLEETYVENSKKPLDQQDIASLLAGYSTLAEANSGLPESLRRIAEAKASALKIRLSDREEFVAVRKKQEDMKQRQVALIAEREELEQRLKTTDIKFYSACGTLRPSSLQVGTSTLYRLTDPANGRTVVYIRSNDVKIATLMSQFVGVKGEVINDTNLSLRVIEPTDFEQIDPSKLYTSVASQIVPPSLMPGGIGHATIREEPK